jgi:hypothetical protein
MTWHRRDDPRHARPAVLRRRGHRVLELFGWVLVWTPRDHALRDL